MKTKSINLNAELREWLSIRLSDTLSNNPDNIHLVVLNLREAKEDIFRLLYEYQVIRQWPSIAVNTALVLGYDEGTIRRMRKRKH